MKVVSRLIAGRVAFKRRPLDVQVDRMRVLFICETLSPGPIGPPASAAATVSSSGYGSGSVNLQTSSSDSVWKVCQPITHTVHVQAGMYISSTLATRL